MTYGYIIGIFLSIFLSIFSLNVYYKYGIYRDPENVQDRIGTKLLATGQYKIALLHYNKLVESYPKKYIYYYRRATAYLGLEMTKLAIEDLISCLSLNPDFNLARSERAKLYIKQAYLQDAKDDFGVLLRQKPDDVESQQSLALIGELESLIESAKTHNERNECNEVITNLNRVSETTTLSQSLREMRGNCFLKIGDSQKAILEFQQIVTLSSDDSAAILRLSKVLYEVGKVENSSIETRHCLKLYPNDKECFKHYKKIKKFVQLLGSIVDDIEDIVSVPRDCISKSNKLKTSESLDSASELEYLCKCVLKAGHTTEAVKTCDSAHMSNPNNIDIVCDLADAHIANEDYNSAVTYFEKALDLDKSFKRAKDGIKKAQNLLKQ